MTGLLSKKSQYVQITPIPSFIPRQLAIDFLHSHGEILELNPLVTGFVAIKAPRDAPADEFYSTWYEISQRIQYIPGAGKLGSGAIKFRGVFHDLPFGLQTHTYAPANVDLRNKWQICGNQPGEPPEPKELGSKAPPEGLYIREDVEIKCNVAMVSFVKKEMKAAAKIMLERLVKKAELLDKGQLQAMMENGKLKTVNLADRTAGAPGRHYTIAHPGGQAALGSPHTLPPSPYQSNVSPGQQYAQPSQPVSPGQQYAQPSQPISPGQQYAQPSQSFTPGQQYAQPSQPSQPLSPGQQYAYPNAPYAPPAQQQHVPPQQLLGQNNIVMELPGDLSYSQPQSQPSSDVRNLHNNRDSKTSSQYSQLDQRWSGVSAMTASRPTSYAPSEGLRSPQLDQKNAFAAELPTMEETREEHDERKKRESQLLPDDQKQPHPTQENFQQYAPAPLRTHSQAH